MKYLLTLIALILLGVGYVYLSTPYDTLTLGSDYLKTPGDYYLTPSLIPAFDAIQRSEARVLCNDDVSPTRGKVVHFIEETNGCYGFSYETSEAASKHGFGTGIIDVSDTKIVNELMRRATPYPKPKEVPIETPPCDGPYG